MTEGKALRELKRGSEEALCFFIERYTPYVSTIIYNIIGAYMSTADIEEVSADVFFAFWQNAEKVRPDAVKGYLGTIARNRAKNKLRELGHDLPLEEAILQVEQLSPETEYEKKQLHAAVRRAVLAMGWPEREIFLRHYYYFQTLDTIAGEMGMNLSTVKTRLRRGRLRLKAALADQLT